MRIHDPVRFQDIPMSASCFCHALAMGFYFMVCTLVQAPDMELRFMDRHGTTVILYHGLSSLPPGHCPCGTAWDTHGSAISHGHGSAMRLVAWIFMWHRLRRHRQEVPLKPIMVCHGLAPIMAALYATAIRHCHGSPCRCHGSVIETQDKMS